MADLKFGNSTVSDMYLGSTQINRLYQGSNLVWFNDYNIVVRESANLVLYNIGGTILKDVAVADMLQMTCDNYYVYVFRGNRTDYHIDLYDFNLNLVDSILLPEMKNGTDYSSNRIVAGSKKIMFYSANSAGFGYRMGYLNLNKNKEVHYTDVTQLGTTCVLSLFYYDKNTNSFYSKRNTENSPSALAKLNEDTYGWEDTGYANFRNANPCDKTEFNMSFINGFANGITSGVVNTHNVNYIYNNREGVITYKNQDGNKPINHVMLNDTIPMVYGVYGNKIFIGTITDLMNENITTMEIGENVITGRYGYFPMFKHQCRNIVLIPLGNTTIPKICIYNIDTATYSIFNCTHGAGAFFLCNAVTVPVLNN